MFFDACTAHISEVHALEKHALLSKRYGKYTFFLLNILAICKKNT